MKHNVESGIVEYLEHCCDDWVAEELKSLSEKLVHLRNAMTDTLDEQYQLVVELEEAMWKRAHAWLERSE